jgi:hypothetical protein
MAGQTTDISSTGVLFTAERVGELGWPIEYVITLNADAPQAVSLRCIGKVVRAERTDPDRPGYRVAATLERYEFVRGR